MVELWESQEGTVDYLSLHTMLERMSRCERGEAERPSLLVVISDLWL